MAAELDRTGVVCLEDVVSTDWLQAAQAHASSLLASNGGRDLIVHGAGDDPDSPAYDLVADATLVQVLEELTRAGCPQGVVDGDGIYSVLRILVGPSSAADPPWFHYDASVVTVVVPICMPSDGASGELVLLPNRRPYRRFVGSNIVEKLLTQNRYRRVRMARRLDQQPDKRVVQLKPGNAYLFWGYRTYHAHLATPPGELRVTLCLHYGRPHGRHPALGAAAYVRDSWRKIRGD